MEKAARLAFLLLIPLSAQAAIDGKGYEISQNASIVRFEELPSFQEPVSARELISPEFQLKADLENPTAAESAVPDDSAAHSQAQAAPAAAASAQPALNAVLPTGAKSLKVFFENSDREVIARNPAMFLQKMKKAAETNFDFFRLANLFDLYLKNSPQAKRIRKTPVLLVHGDIHPKNVQIVKIKEKKKKTLVPQFNDVDDSAYGPVAVDQARMLASAVLLGDGSAASSKKFYERAKKSYMKSLKMNFGGWKASLSGEKSVSRAVFAHKNWMKNAGRPIKNGEPAWIFKAAGKNPSRWKIFNRTGAGGSSIGLLRYMLVSKTRGDAVDIKELRDSAVTYFTGKTQPLSNRARVASALKILGRTSFHARALSAAGHSWILWLRSPKEAVLNTAHPKSAARVMAGLAAQAHRIQVKDPSELKEALEAVPLSLILDAVKYMADMRQALVQLLNQGAWDNPPSPE